MAFAILGNGNNVQRPSRTAAPYRPLGALRFALSMMVCLYHAGWVLPRSTRWFFFEMGLGSIAVAAFFVISGFVIAESCSVFYAGRPGAFLLNRIVRLVPPYLAAMAVAAIAQQCLYLTGRLALWDGHLIGSPLQPLVLLAGVLDIVPFFRPDYIGAQNVHFIPFSWSLRIEFAFYLYVAATLAAAGLFRSRRRDVIAWAMAAAYAAFLVYAAVGRGPKQLEAIPMFGFGIALFFLLRKRSPLNLLHASLMLIAVGVAFPLWEQMHDPVIAYQLPILAVLVAILVALVFWFAPSRAERHGAVPARPRLRALDVAMGGLSYPLYLNHFIVILAIWNLTTDYGWPVYILSVGGSLVLAAVMQRLVEQPMTGIRNRIRGFSVGGDQVRRSNPRLEASNSRV